jgi:hypothetical protein
MTKSVAIIILSSFLGGCITIPPMTGTPESIARSIEACKAYGFEQGSASFAYCVQNDQAQKRASANANAAAAAAMQPREHNVNIRYW